MAENIKYYETLSKVDVSKMLEQKSGLSYLTWSKAFDELLKKYPDMTYEIIKFDGKPYYMDESGAMVFTTMTIEGITREMWLPVLDGANKPMKEKAYKYQTKYSGEKTCDAINMFDINKAIMRCLVKNIAVFGLGLNVYAGEDLPLGADEVIEKTNGKVSPESITQAMYEKYPESSKEKIRQYFAKKNSLESMTEEEFYFYKSWTK